MTHATSSGGLSSLALDAPVVGTELGSGVTALGAGLLLLVIGTIAATLAERMSLSMAFTKTGSTLSLLIIIIIKTNIKYVKCIKLKN